MQHAPPRRALRNVLVAAFLTSVLLSGSPSSSNFLGSQPRLTSRIPRRSFESGMINKGADTDNPGEGDQPTASVPEPVIECDQACVVAIQECVEDGCSIEAMEKLDAILAGDEKQIQSIVDTIHNKEHTEVEPGITKGSLEWLENYLQRSGFLRAQIHALKGADVDGSFMEQMMKAASVAFGGGRKGDYPKVGVSPYSA
mmetsp:Transcript_20175/g.36546  ORF Transcript_20175/g.36546 Transcript_20175/m.36546 type:complete len:199 (+) Transcript_20175:84-680(+)